MNHSFDSSQLDATKCKICKHEQIDHTDRATCEGCGNSGNCFLYPENAVPSTAILLCQDCKDKEEKHIALISSTNKSNGGVSHVQVNHSDLIKQAMDFSLHNWTEIFNARPVPIHELKKAIDSDISIDEGNRHFTLAKIMDKTHKEYQLIILQMNTKLKELVQHDMQIQLFYNEFAKNLKIEERATLSLKDVNYDPTKIKEPKPRAITTKKFDDKKIREIAIESGIDEMMIKIAMSKGASHPIDAVRAIKLTLEKAMTLDAAIKEVKTYSSTERTHEDRKVETKPKQYDGNELARVSKASGYPSFLIQQIIIRDKCTAEEAVAKLKGGK